MDGIPPVLKSDLEDVAWALETAEALWKRGERVDAVVWVRRAAQAAGEGDDAKRAASLGSYAAELGDWIASHTVGGESAGPRAQSERSLEALDALLGDPGEPAPPLTREGSDAFVLSTNDVELVVSSRDFEAGFGAHPPAVPAAPVKTSKGPNASDSEVMTVSLHAPDVEVFEDGIAEEDFEDEPTPVVVHSRSPVPEAGVPSAAEAHAGMLDPWAEAEAKRKARESNAEIARPAARPPSFDDEEVITSAKHQAPARPLPPAPPAEAIPRAPKAPKFPPPRAKAAAEPPAARPPAEVHAEEEEETTTYRQINARAPKPGADPSAAPPRPAPKGGPLARPPRPTASSPAQKAAAPKPPEKARERVESIERVERPAPPKPPPPAPVISKPLADAQVAAKSPPTPPTPPTKPQAPERSVPPSLDLLEMVDSVSIPELPAATPEPAESAPPTPVPLASAAPTPAPLGSAAPTPPPLGSAAPTPAPGAFDSMAPSGRPTAPPQGSMPVEAMPSAVPTRPRAGQTLLDLSSVEALTDLPDDARDAFADAATMHTIARDEEVSHFALALVVDGEIDVSATIVDAPALRLEKGSVLRSRGTIVPGVGLRLVCASDKALLATWDDAAVEAAFKTCPWVEEDLRAVADKVQAKAGVTMGPFGDRFDQSLREHLLGKLALRVLSAGEVLVAQGKPTPIAIVGIGELVLTKEGAKSESLGPGDILFPTQILSHAPAPSTAAAGAAGAVVLYGDRAVAQELLMTFPPLLELLATI